MSRQNAIAAVPPLSPYLSNPHRTSLPAGTKAPKSQWRFTKAGEDWFCFAGLWRPATEGVPEAFTLPTTAPGPDVAPIHNRQMVVLERADWLAWLELSRSESELLKPLPAGSLLVEQVR
ncbi:MAG: SOS response-associated peptidase family protein [Acetobacteraceae bacterium]|nr:SOS response-associated peptidase family protein [Acetobacteraceae bacterium]